VNLPIEDVAEPSEPASQQHAIEERSRHDALRRAVLALPHRYREPVILFYFHEMDVGAAALTLKMPEGTLKARLSRARSLLARRFPHLKDESAPMKLAGKEI
jgi:RNA polymerase sigma-70 factor, ECF subfamily